MMLGQFQAVKFRSGMNERRQGEKNYYKFQIHFNPLKIIPKYAQAGINDKCML